MPASITPAAAIADPHLLAPSFAGPSWDLWRAILKAAFAEPMTDAEKARFREVADREPPTRKVRELWIVAGRRSGKDSIAAAIATVAGLGDYSANLRPGERASIMCLAADRNQSKIVHRYILGNFNTIPLLAPMVERSTEETIELNNRVEVVVSTNSYRAVRGRSVICAIFDEVAFWRDDSSATPDMETYKAIEPSLATFPDAMLIGISSPYRKAGLVYDTWKKYYGTEDDEVLVVRGPSKLFNPTLPQSIIDKALERDPESAGAEWMAEWRADIAAFVTREAIEACTVPGRFELPPTSGMYPVAFIDASGGSGTDSMTCALAFRDGEKAVLAAVRERRPPFSPDDVVMEFSALMKSYGVTSAESDKWGGDWVGEAFRKHGIRVEPCAKPKSDIYREVLPELNSGRVELLDLPRLATQFCALERRVSRNSKGSIDHPPSGKDDLCNAAAGALLMATVNASMVISDELLNRMRSMSRNRSSIFNPAF